MKDEFPAFYRPTKDEFDVLWAKCTFVFDTNTLLNLYRYSPEASQDLINTLKKLSAYNRLWIPHQTALEYHQNRLNVIIKEKSKYKPLSGIIDVNIKNLKDAIKKDDRDRKNTYAASIVSALEKVIDQSSTQIKGELKSLLDSQPDRIEKDEIRDVLSEIFKDRIGKPYEQKKLEDIYKKCDKRYELRIPPGYEDAKDSAKNGRAKYGDAILWLQLIDYAKEKKSSVILVTDDDKEDWWNPETEEKNDKQPNYDLIQEFTSMTGKSIFMYSTDRFLYWAKKQIGAEVRDETIAEIKQVKSTQDALDTTKKIQLKQTEGNAEMIAAMLQSPQLVNLFIRQTKGESIGPADYMRALADTNPEVAQLVIKGIVASQTKGVKEGDII